MACGCGARRSDALKSGLEDAEIVVDAALDRALRERTEAGGEAGEFDLSLAVDGLFLWIDPHLDEDFRRAWLGLNGRYLLWPYARSYAAMITSASSLPPLTLFTMQIPGSGLGALVETADAEEGSIPSHGSPAA